MTNFDVYLADAKTVAIAGHVRPDGDCAGSCLATYNYIKNKGNKFSGEQKKAIEQLQAGDKFYITSITVSGGQKTDEQIGSINVVLY